jgi:hypothetical protein
MDGGTRGKGVLQATSAARASSGRRFVAGIEKQSYHALSFLKLVQNPPDLKCHR